jgi:hypothetical protein
MFDLNKTVGLLPVLLSICLLVRPAEAGHDGADEITASSGTSTYIFLPEQSSTVIQEGGIAGVHWTYFIEGQFQLTFNPNASTAFFTHVDTNAVDDSPYRRTLDPNEVFNMTGLVGIIIDDTIIVFAGKATDGSDILIIAILNDDLIYLFGQTYPPIGSADFFIFNMDAIAQRKYGGGTGEPNDPYLIYTAEQLNEIGLFPCEWDKHFKLMADINLSSYSETTFNIIGRYIRYPSSGYKPFSGVFDGNGKKLSNLSYSSKYRSYIGLFGYVEGAEIKSLGLIDPNVSLNDGGGCVGLLTGWLRNSTITNCYVEGCSISGSSTVGGLVGDSYNSTIKNSYFQGSVSGGSEVGGLVGLNRGTIIDCYSSGQVSGTGQQAGGLVGENLGTIRNCTASANVSGGKKVGGLVGSQWGGRIIDCCATGSVTADEEVGGLIGGNNGIISNCYTTSDVAGKMYVGGFAGQNGLNLTDVVYGGRIYNCYARGNVIGEVNVGGLVGYNDSFGTICNCYATGVVSGVEEVGGLVGQNRNGEVTNSFWDIETSGQSTSDAGTGITTVQMQNSGTFIAWGCDGVWTINELSDYPRLAWENQPGEPITKPSYGGGDGTKEQPYLIYTAEHFNEIGLCRCDWDKHFKLMADIDLGGYIGMDFNIIGYYIGHHNYRNIPFTGVFDGNDNMISNFTYICDEENNVGLFSYVGSNGHIENIQLVDPNIDAGTGRYIGSLIGYLEGGTVSRCHVMSGSVRGQRDVGGLVGRATGSDTENVIENSHFLGTVQGYMSVGGLVGVIYYGKIIGCSTDANVSGDWSVGGLVGDFFSPELAHCHTAGVITGNSWVGGLVGKNWPEGEIHDCNSIAEVRGVISVGGLVGVSWGKVNGCRASGSVIGGDRLGGLVGYNGGTLVASQARCSVKGEDSIAGFCGINVGTISNCCSMGDIVGTNAVGGLLGENDIEGTVSACYADANVTGDGYVGGLVGNNNGRICECYSTSSVYGSDKVGGFAGENGWDGGSISNCYSHSIVDGNEAVGGLVGCNVASILNSYSTGVVNGNTYIGGLSGRNFGVRSSVIGSFWNIQTSNKPTSSGGTGKTTVEMQMASTFLDAGWDFVGETENGAEDIWWILEGKDYPRLWWEAEEP